MEIREKPKHISSQEYSFEVYKINKKMNVNKNYNLFKRIYSRSEIEVGSFIEKRIRENINCNVNNYNNNIERKKSSSNKRLEIIKRKLRFPNIDKSKEEINSFVNFKGRRMKKSKSQKYQSNIDLIYSINSFFNSEIKKPNENNNNSRVKFISSYSTRKNNNLNIKKLNKFKNENYRDQSNRITKYNLNLRKKGKLRLNENTWLKEVSEKKSKNINSEDLIEIIRNHSSKKSSRLQTQNFQNLFLSSRQNTENIIEEENRFTLYSERKIKKRKLSFKDNNNIIMNEKSTNTTPQNINKRYLNNDIHISPDNTLLTPIPTNSPGNYNNSSDLNYLNLSNDKSGIINNNRNKRRKKNINKSSSKNNSEYEDNKMNSNYYNSDEEFNSSKNDISNVRRNNFSSEDDSVNYNNSNKKRRFTKRDIIIVENPRTGKNELIDNETGNKVNDLLLSHNEKGEIILLYSKTHLPVIMKPIRIDKKTGNKIISIYESKKSENEKFNKNKKNYKNENEDDDIICTSKNKFIKKGNEKMQKDYIEYECSDLELVIDPENGKEILIDKETGEEIDDIEKKIINNKVIFIDKNTGKEIDNIIKTYNPETEEEIYKRMSPVKKNKVNIISNIDPKTGKEILIDKETGEKIENLEKIKDPKTGEIKLINKYNGEEIKGIKIKKDPLTGNEIINIKMRKKDNQSQNNIIISKKDDETGEEILIDKNTGKVCKNLEKILTQ